MDVQASDGMLVQVKFKVALVKTNMNIYSIVLYRIDLRMNQISFFLSSNYVQIFEKSKRPNKLFFPMNVCLSGNVTHLNNKFRAELQLWLIKSKVGNKKFRKHEATFHASTILTHGVPLYHLVLGFMLRYIKFLSIHVLIIYNDGN